MDYCTWKSRITAIPVIIKIKNIKYNSMQMIGYISALLCVHNVNKYVRFTTFHTIYY